MLCLGVACCATCVAATRTNPPPPNIIFILADDLGYGDIGCYGQTKIQTPNLDRMAAEGIRFTQFYAGSTVCAPSRSVLMTGLHTGHTRVRGNAGQKNPEAQILRDEDVTVAEVLKKAGYATGLIGKWGLGQDGTSGHPNRQGFDYFFGYLDQTHAHNHFPDFLWRNTERVPLANGIVPVGKEGAGYATNRVEYAGDLFAREALAFIEKHAREPFFLFYSVVVPHANNERARALKDGMEVPDYGPYAGMDWTAPNKGYAAMITRMDADVGRLLSRLKQLGLDERTIVFFSSDNGPQKEGGNDPTFFASSGPWRGIKRDLYEGGIRVPLIARWPKHIAPGTVSGHVGYFGDFMATAAELAGVKPPAKLDSISFLPTLLGRANRQPTHDYLYWEFYERGFSQAVLIDGRWKAIRLKDTSQPIAIYDLKNDPGESNDVSSQNGRILKKAARLMQAAHQPSELWPVPQPKPQTGDAQSGR